MTDIELDVKDLDALVPQDLKVRLGGSTYSIPGDMPLSIFLRVQSATVDDELEQHEVVVKLADAFFDLLSWRIPENDRAVREALRQSVNSLGVTNIMRLLNALYADLTGDDEEVTDPTPESETTTTTSPSPAESPTPNSTLGPASSATSH